jgi:hypothetical protein
MTLNGSDVRDIVCVLRVSSATVIDVLKKNLDGTRSLRSALLNVLMPSASHCGVEIRCFLPFLPEREREQLPSPALSLSVPR